MASVKVMLRDERTLKKGLYPIVIRVINGTEKREIPTGFRVRKGEWDPQGFVGKSHPDAKLINASLEMKRAEVVKNIYESEMQGKPLHLERLGDKRKANSFTGYLIFRAANYRAQKNELMARRVEHFVEDLQKCFKGVVYFEDIDIDWARKYDALLIERKNGSNYRAKKIRTLKDWFQNAIDERRADGPNALNSYTIGQTPIEISKLSLAQIQAIEKLEISDSSIRLSRDLFLFSFYCKGARFENCITMPQGAIQGDRICWKANKKGKFMSAVIHDRLRALIEQYAKKGEENIFPLIKTKIDDDWRRRKTVDSWNALTNGNLKIIAALAGIKFNLTFHMARHSFAYALKQNSNNIHVIKEALGHGRSSTTEMYLKALDDQMIDPEVGKVYEY